MWNCIVRRYGIFCWQFLVQEKHSGRRQKSRLHTKRASRYSIHGGDRKKRFVQILIGDCSGNIGMSWTVPGREPRPDGPFRKEQPTWTVPGRVPPWDGPFRKEQPTWTVPAKDPTWDRLFRKEQPTWTVHSKEPPWDRPFRKERPTSTLPGTELRWDRPFRTE